MAASNPSGEMQFWFNGLPFLGIQKSGNDGGEMQFWFNGLSYRYLYPASVAPSVGNEVFQPFIQPSNYSFPQIVSV